jgi:hypothetical protein
MLQAEQDVSTIVRRTDNQVPLIQGLVGFGKIVPRNARTTVSD